MAEALEIAKRMGVPLGKSTLQRWAKIWAEMPQHDVKSILLVTRTSRHYEIDRDDYESWLLEQAENQLTPPGPMRSREVLKDLDRPHETSQDAGRSHEASAEEVDAEVVDEQRAHIAALENENMQLKIDVGVRRELVTQAKTEMDRLHGSIEQILKENGALDFQLRQLGAPTVVREEIAAPQPIEAEVDNEESERPPLV